MATYVDSGMLEQQASVEEIHDMMLKKAHDLFALCDKENKGFISKRDMQRLQTELPLNPDQLEDVFDSLDDDGNGFLTREEFTEGFGGFIGLGPSMEKQASVDSSSSTGAEHVYEERGDDDQTEEHFQEVMDTIGVHTVIDDPDMLKSLWSRLRDDNPDLLPMYETFLSRVSGELKRKDQVQQSLETALRTKATAHDEAVRKLSEEMEQQIKVEKERVIAEERAKERQRREDLERNIAEKDSQLNELLSNHSEIKRKLDCLNSQEFETKQENEKLLKDKQELEDLLIHSQTNLDDSRSYVSELRGQYRTEKKERAMAALKISEGIAMERESLVKQLEMLRDMNKKLRDDQDEAELRRQSSNLQQDTRESSLNGELRAALALNERLNTSTPSQDGSRDQADGAPITQDTVTRQQSLTGSVRSRSGAQLAKQGSIMSNYFSPDAGRDGSMSMGLDSDEDIECDDPIMLTNQSPAFASGHAAGMSLAHVQGQLHREYLHGVESGAVHASTNDIAAGASMTMRHGQSDMEYLNHATGNDAYKSGPDGISLANGTDQSQADYLASTDRRDDSSSANHREALLSLAAQSGESITNPSHDLSLAAEHNSLEGNLPSSPSRSAGGSAHAHQAAGLREGSPSRSRSGQISSRAHESASHGQAVSPHGSHSHYGTSDTRHRSRSPQGSRSRRHRRGSDSSEGSVSGSESPHGSRSSHGLRSQDGSRSRRVRKGSNSSDGSMSPHGTHRNMRESNSLEESMLSPGSASHGNLQNSDSHGSKLHPGSSSRHGSRSPDGVRSIHDSRSSDDLRSADGSRSLQGSRTTDAGRSPHDSRSSHGPRSKVGSRTQDGSRSSDSAQGSRSNSPTHRVQTLSETRSSSNDSTVLDGTRPKHRTPRSGHLGAEAGAYMNGEFDIQSPRGVPVGANSSSEATEYHHHTEKELESASPERLFKLVFVGDSGVGKSSFIHQFCSRTFKPTFSATIGVDFQVKNMRVDGHIIALQLWDTAGQERFRSITKQYFRKADGVLVMYDVTSELSFRNIRNWMTSVQDGTGESTVVAIAGNKVDLIDDEGTRVVTTKDGSKLADEFGTLFYEVSAKSGLNVVETLQGMASLLREREDEEMEKALNLAEADDGKKKCCG